jgi:hypothetical protein
VTITLIGDFADPLSFLASQRVEHIRSLGLHDVEWFAVEADRTRPVGGAAVDESLVARVQRLAAAGEAVPAPELRVPSSRAATAAYAESFTDGVPEAMRRALFDALWVHARNIGDPEVIRSIVFDVLSPLPPYGDIDWRIRANLPIVPLGDADPIATTRRLGFIVSSGRGPLTVTGQERIDEWRRFWRQQHTPELPLLLTGPDEVFVGDDALAWLARQLPHPSTATAPAGASYANATQPLRHRHAPVS